MEAVKRYSTVFMHFMKNQACSGSVEENCGYGMERLLIAEDERLCKGDGAGWMQIWKHDPSFMSI